MASVVYMCVVVLLAAISQATNIVKGLYCQDPDTGKLYPVNATWPSQTFCGNYTCKVRKRNITETEYVPIQKIDISKFYTTKEDEDIATDMVISPSDSSMLVTKKLDNDKQFIFHKDIVKNTEKEITTHNNDLKVNDDYLSESEIKSITDMLHTVKKSDLEAIVDIYNLAQDIYKDIDSVNNKKLVKESQGVKKMGKAEEIKNQQSYWYDPAHYHNKLIDMSREEANVISTNKPPINSNPTFFKGPLSDKDFGKLPYYYPISNFQRLSSYTHTKPPINDLEKAPSETKPCTKAANHYVPSPGYYNTPIKKPDNIATPRPSTLLPYPFSYIYHYNISGYQPNYYYNYPWAHAEYSRHRNYPQPYYGAYIVQIPNYGPYTKKNNSEKNKSTESSSSEIESQIKLTKSAVEKRPLPEWQTEPLSEKVLEEVRAHLEKPKSLKPITLKKNIKLERVGKVIKLDELTRTRREVDIDEIEDNESDGNELEVYIEKTICENSTEPGYFSIGNMSQPYPACCPQKLDSIHTARKVIKIN